MQLPLTIIIVLCVAVGFALASLFDYKKFRVKNKEIEELKIKFENLLKSKPEDK